MLMSLAITALLIVMATAPHAGATSHEPQVDRQIDPHEAIRRGEKAFQQADFANAAKWYRNAALQGNSEAQIQLGLMLYAGLDGPPNSKAAVDWFRKAAEQDDADGQAQLGQMYELGFGVPLDNAIAVRWYIRAAAQENSFGQFRLGSMYELGKGVQRNMAEAAYWYRKAATQGFKAAKQTLQRMQNLQKQRSGARR